MSRALGIWPNIGAPARAYIPPLQAAEPSCSWCWAMGQVLAGHSVRRRGTSYAIEFCPEGYMVFRTGSSIDGYLPIEEDLKANDWELATPMPQTNNRTCDCGYEKWKWIDGHVRGCPDGVDK